MTFTITAEERKTILAQIRPINVLSISGGRVNALSDGVELPVSNGYRVRVHLTPTDEYIVERVFVRSGKVSVKGAETHYCDTVGGAAYRASCFRNDDAEYWPNALDKPTTSL